MAKQALIADLVVANRILFDQQVLDGFGHVSVRDERDPQRFWLARSMAAGLVEARDVMQFDLDGAPVDARGRAVFLERFIHGEIYRARPDVQSVIHSHSPNLVPFGVTPVKLKPLYHMTGFLGGGVPVFEIRRVAGTGTNLLITDNRLGKALAKTLGGKPAALMRGHGSVVVGENLPRAVGRSLYLEVSARMQLQATMLAGPGGKIAFMDESEVSASVPTQEYNRAWPAWRAWALEQLGEEASERR
jgi:ribulose-5-phosphate 4-epimerase/fuculose-1-phosphate aldolase